MAPVGRNHVGKRTGELIDALQVRDANVGDAVSVATGGTLISYDRVQDTIDVAQSVYGDIDNGVVSAVGGGPGLGAGGANWVVDRAQYMIDHIRTSIIRWAIHAGDRAVDKMEWGIEDMIRSSKPGKEEPPGPWREDAESDEATAGRSGATGSDG